MAVCDGCKLGASVRHPCVDGEGPGGGLLLVGEAPGEEEDRRGRPFVGPTGQLLRRAAAQWLPAGLPVRFTNAVRCYPGERKVRAAMAPCRDYLLEEIKRYRPTRIIAFGQVAAQQLTGYPLPITQVDCGWTTFDGIPLQFAIHPSAQLHNRAVAAYWRKTVEWIFKNPPPTWASYQNVVVDIPQLEDAAVSRVQELCGQRVVALDTEYNSANNRLLCLALAAGPDRALALPDALLGKRPVQRALRELLEHTKIAAHNWKFDALVLCKTLGVDPEAFKKPDGWWLDTSTLRKLYHPEQDSNLEIAAWMVGMGGHKEPLYSVLGKSHKGPAYERAYESEPDLVLRYCGWDAVACYRLVLHYGRQLHRDGFWPLWREVFGPLGSVLWTMERQGLHVDTEAMNALDQRLTAALKRELIQIRSSADVRKLCAAWDREVTAEAFNPKSGPQLRDLLFDHPAGLQLKALAHTDKGEKKADKHALKEYKAQHPVLEHVAEFNRIKGKRSTYVRGYRKRLDIDEILHTSYRQDTARTQRLSSQNPNLQNIPNRDWEEDKAIRRMIVPHDPEREVLLKIDYSQIEMRIAAELSNDPVMMECFLKEIDIHRRTAASVLGCRLEDVTRSQRQSAKPINFGSIFDMSPQGLKENAKKEYGVDLTDDEAVAWNKGFFRLYRGYRLWMLREVTQATKRGCAYVYWLGKPFARRWLSNLGLRNRAERGEQGHARRQAINTPVQGGASLYTLRTLNEVHRRLCEPEGIPGVSKLLHTVHDEIIVSVLRGQEERAFRAVASIMVSWPTLRVPLAVEGSVGPTLGSLQEKYKLSSFDGLNRPLRLRLTGSV